MSKQSSWVAFGGGLAGAIALTAMHQYVKKINSNAPRMDFLGMEAITKALKNADKPVPDYNNLYYITMAGDVLSNAVYYSAAGIGNKQTWLKGALLGLAAGAGAIYLPKPMGLNEEHSTRTPETKALTMLYYLTGGLVASGGIKLLGKSRKKTSKIEVK